MMKGIDFCKQQIWKMSSSFILFFYFLHFYFSSEKMVLSRATRPIAQRAVSMSATRAAVDTKSDSFAFGIMQGKVNPQHIFPYPSTLTEDETEMLEAMVDPFESVGLSTFRHNYLVRV